MTDAIKAITRPMLTFVLIVSWILFVAAGYEFPMPLQGAALGTLAWWGIDRSLLHRFERK